MQYIPHEDKPSIAQVHDLILPIVKLTVSNTLSRRVHYENELYPAILSLLICIFPLKRGFVLAHRGILRPVIEPNDDNPGVNGSDHSPNPDDASTQTSLEEVDTSAPSFSSTGAMHLPRGAAEEEVGKEFPDFIVSKIYPNADGTYSRKILTIIEVKRNDEHLGDGISQALRYIESARGQSCHTGLRSYLVVNDKYLAIDLGGSGGTDHSEQQHPVFVDPPHPDSLTSVLCGLASEYWN